VQQGCIEAKVSNQEVHSLKVQYRDLHVWCGVYASPPAHKKKGAGAGRSWRGLEVGLGPPVSARSW
jgi:hypothetical protein